MAVEERPHRVDSIVVRIGRAVGQILMSVDGDPLFIWRAAYTIIGGNVVRVTVVGRDPVGCRRRAMRMNRNGDDLGWDGRVRLLGRANCEVVRAILVVEELVGQD